MYGILRVFWGCVQGWGDVESFLWPCRVPSETPGTFPVIPFWLGLVSGAISIPSGGKSEPKIAVKRPAKKHNCVLVILLGGETSKFVNFHPDPWGNDPI